MSISKIVYDVAPFTRHTANYLVYNELWLVEQTELSNLVSKRVSGIRNAHNQYLGKP